MTIQYALSIKQPWATLLIHGIKSVEIRKWPTARRARVLIHAGRVADDREHGWNLLPPDLKDKAKLLGGFLGSAELKDCRTYRTSEEFTRDQHLHCNHPDWWQGPKLYGFHFVDAQPSDFVPYPGWMRFFPVPDLKIKE